MKIRPTKQYMVSLESIAMTDIVLNMFIFFFISFSILYTFNPTKSKHIRVNLPKAKNVATSQSKGEAVQITVSSEGPIYLDGRVVTLKELQESLVVTIKRNPQIPVNLQIDRLVAFKNVVRILDVLNGLGIERLRIAAEEEEK